MGPLLFSPQTSERTPDSTTPAPPGAPLRPPLTRVVLMGGTPDDRLLLRGLLRLHRHRVAAEIPAVDALRDLVPSDERKVLIFQVDPTGAGWCDDLAAALARDRSMVAVVLTRARSPEFDRRATGAGARAVLQRPFTVRDLVATVEAVGRGENLLGTPALRDSEEARQG